MRVAVVGTGGVGSAFAGILARRSFFEHCALADYDDGRPRAIVAALDDGRFSAHAVDTSSVASVLEFVRTTRADAVLNAVDPRFNEQVFDTCLQADVTYLDMAMTLSEPHPERPFEETGVTLGDYQFARSEEWSHRGLLALVGIGIEPAPRTCSRATPPTISSRRSTRSASATAPTSSSTDTTSRRRSRSGRRSRNA